MTRDQRERVKRIKAAIVYHAEQCEQNLRLADFAASNLACLSAPLSRMASYHSDRAFEWADLLRMRAAA